jgi:hypothetical protein
MDDIYYLVHSTDKNPSSFKFLRKTQCSEADGDQFPGVYMTLVTKHTIDTEEFFPGKYTMIFSKELLKQKNYHINLMDCNGMVTEHVTYFPWNIDEAVKGMQKDTYGGMSEVVFHDKIDVRKYLCKILNESDELPRQEMKTATAAEPDMTRLPYYCYTNEDEYTGVPVPPKSSLEWFQLLVRVANIPDVPSTKQECIDALREKAVYLCNNRNKQNIQLLKDYTERRSATVAHNNSAARNKTSRKTRKRR